MTDLAKVAEALGWQRSGTQIYPRRALGCVIDTGRPLDMNGVWLIVEAMRERGWLMQLHNDRPDRKWLCDFYHEDDPVNTQHREPDAPTAPAAILAAAAKALGVSDE